MSVDVALGKILGIAGNGDSRDLLAKLLRMSGYDVISANDGEAGLAEAFKQEPDLIISDIHMPNMNGIEFVQRVRKDQALDKTPVLVVTAFGAHVAREAINAGADAAAEKPFDFDRFLLTVEDLIAKRKTAATRRIEPIA